MQKYDVCLDSLSGIQHSIANTPDKIHKSQPDYDSSLQSLVTEPPQITIVNDQTENRPIIDLSNDQMVNG